MLTWMNVFELYAHWPKHYGKCADQMGFKMCGNVSLVIQSTQMHFNTRCELPKYWVWSDVQPLTSTNKMEEAFSPIFPCYLQPTGMWIWYREMFWSVFVFLVGGPEPSAPHHASSLHDLLNSLPAEHHVMFETKAEIWFSWTPLWLRLVLVPRTSRSHLCFLRWGRERRRCLD